MTKTTHIFWSYTAKGTGLKSVLALCFTEARETYHHWHVFADGSSGICIRFDREKLIKAVEKQVGVTAKKVEYLTLKEIRQKKLKLRELPFLKRYPYGDECEFRIIYESSTEKRSSLDISISLDCIYRVTLSPWIPKTLDRHVRRTIRSINGCEKLEVARSTLISNERWKELGDEAG